MKPTGPARPEPAPPPAEVWSLSISLIAVSVGCSFGLASFHDAKAVTDIVYEAFLVFVWAVPMGAIVAVMQERRAYLRANRDSWHTTPTPEDTTTLHYHVQPDATRDQSGSNPWQGRERR